MNKATNDILLGLGLAVLAFGASIRPSHAALLNLSNKPFGAASGASPNVVLTLDESGSMESAYLPDDVSGESGNVWFCSVTVNKIYYDPNANYDNPLNYDGTEIRVTASAARTDTNNPFTNSAATINLTGTNYVPARDSRNDASCGQPKYTSGAQSGQTIPQKPFYFSFNASLAGCRSTGSAQLKDANCYEKKTVTDATELEKFARWYSFYRTRTLAAKTAISRAFQRFDDNVRVAGQVLKQPSGFNSATMFGATLNGTDLKSFTDANKQLFYTKLFNAPAGDRTPLRTALRRVGEFYRTNAAYRIDPSISNSAMLSCRQNFHVLITDGYWNDDGNNGDDPPPPSVGEVDNSNGTLGDKQYADVNTSTTAYTAQAPYAQSIANTLADYAMYYWMTDLSSQTNNVPVHIAAPDSDRTKQFYDPRNDPAYWQHMVNYTIGLGVPGTRDPRDYIKADGTQGYVRTHSNSSADPTPIGASITWATSDSTPARLDDLWHTAINSRGKYFNTTEASQLSNAFASAVNDILVSLGSLSSAATNGGSLTTNSRLYQAQFDKGWTGHLWSYPLNSSTGSVSAAEWDAATKIPAPTSRTILTYGTNGTTLGGSGFQWTSLTTAEQNVLSDNPSTSAVETSATDGQARLNYLRGVRGDEGASGLGFRSRAGLLGDIVNSAPAIAGNIDYGYRDDIEGSANSYSAFRSTLATRKPVIYVGANDGMLHGFDGSFDSTSNAATATAGTEVLAYVPSMVYKKLNRLTDPGYDHQFYVDGSPTVVDAFIAAPACSGACWRTVLVGGLGAGGQGYYALDVTDPSTFSEANSAARRTVLWEFSDSNDADLGYTFSQPAIVRVHDNGSGTATWAAVFGNGYNNSEADGHASTTGYATLYVVNLATGALIKKISTQTGSSGTPNGLATTMPVDVDGDGTVDYVYAGDLLGNLWKFNIKSSNANDWDVAFKTSTGTPKPLFTTGTGQPITERPEVGPHPNGLSAGVMVYFGTGKALEKTDNDTSSAVTQAFYGIWDKDIVSATAQTVSATPVARADLLAQTIASTTPIVGGKTYRTISNNAMTWRTGTVTTGTYLGWYVNLPGTGERSISNPILRGKRIVFTTSIPVVDSCTGSTDGWLMELDTGNGGALSESPFDTDANGSFTTNDLISGNAPAGVQSPDGQIASPVVLAGPGKEYKYGSSTKGTIVKIDENPGAGPGRRSWRQIK